MPQIRFTLNGRRTEASYEPGMHLLEVLREECGIVSAKNGCAPEGACGCCLVQIDGKPALSCLRKPEQTDGHDVVTLEGIPEATRRLMGEAFVLEGGVQCGFCIPGIVVRAAALVEKGKTGDRAAIAKALDGHLCRCTGYGRIIDAIQTAGEAAANGGCLTRTEPRRNSFFGEELGLQRNPAFANGNGNGTGHGIGRSIARQGGAAQTLGDKPFVDDMRVPGMLHGAMVLTEHARARIVRIRTDEAAAMPGVVRVLTAADVPGFRGTGLNDPDQPVFVAEGETTCCVADFLAMVVADTQFHARQAASRVRIDYEVLEPLTDPFEAMKPGAPLVHPADTFSPRSSNILQPITAFSRGDVDAALAQAAHVIETTFQTQPIEIAFLEPEACLAVPQGDGVKVYTDSQGSVYDHQQIAKVLNLDPKHVEIALCASGGAFGAKEELSIQAQTAIASRLLDRPVKTVLTREQSTQHHVKRHAMWITLTVGADADGHLLALRSRIVADAGGYHTTSAKCALRAACHSCGVYRVPNVEVEAKAVYTNNPNAGAMRGFGSNQAQFAMEGIMDMLAEKVGVDGWDIRERNILNPGDALGTGQIMRDSVRGIRETLLAVKDVYKSAKYKGVGCGIKSTGLGNGTTEGGYIVIRVVDGPKLEILNGYTEMGQGVYTATMQAVCEETDLPPEIMTVLWDKELGEKCGETWASRGTTLSCAAAQHAARKLSAELDSLPLTLEPLGRTPDPALRVRQLAQLVGRQYAGEYVCNFTTRPGTPESILNPTTHLTFSYAAQVVILDEQGKTQRVLVANDVGRAINPRLCAEQMEGGVHMGLGYALSENFTSTKGVPDSLALRDLGIVAAKHMPDVDVILIEVPDEVGGYGAKGVGEIGCVATAGAVAGALHSYDGIRRVKLPMDDAPAAKASLPKSRSRSAQSTLRKDQRREH
ncbi:MAG TPA: molybdopterin cofactor-binding domain-containing protein [Vicinamibacterales bacterium]|nr:molybdopterin cofactor-binding domain-containing protein [Vicinamibacterales bacterium]